MKLTELLNIVPVDTNIIVFKSDKYYSNTEYRINDCGTLAELFSRNDFIDKLGDCEVIASYPSMYGYDDCIMSIALEG